MFAQVVPVKRGKISLPFFDYEVPAELLSSIRIGQLVEVPLRSKTELGIIRSLSETSSYSSTKPIKSILYSKPFLCENAVKFLEEMSLFYHTSLGSLMKTALLPLQKRKLSKIATDFPDAPIIKKTSSKPRLFTYNNREEQKSYYLNAIAPEGQTLFLVPEAADIEPLAELLPEHSNDIIRITGYLSDKELFTAWLQIWSGEKKIIIGTRRALLLSFYDLRTIIIENDAHGSHKSWDAAPRFHARDAALIALKHYGTTLHLACHTPSVESYYFAEHSIYETVNPKLFAEIRLPHLIDLRHEHRAKNYSPLGYELQEALLETKGSVFLFCHRKGSASYVMCRDCATVMLCTSCQRPMTYHESRGELVCHHDGTRGPMRSECEKCGGVNLAFFGSGTEAIAKEVKKLLPKDTREIITIEGNEASLKKIRSGTSQIIVGTQLAWSHLEWKSLSLMAFIDADTPLFVPEFRSSEHVWQLVHDALFRTPKDSPVLIQTSHPEHKVYTSLGQPTQFYEMELKERRLFGYPPHRFLLKLFYGAPTKEMGLRESARLFTLLSQLTKASPDIKITPPLELFPAFYKGNYWRALILKLAYKNYKQLSISILKQVPETWKVDPNPNTLLSL